MSEKFYLCGPVSLGGTLSEKDVKINIERFKELEFELNTLNPSCLIFNPINLPKLAQWEDYMRLTIPMVCECDTVLLLKGWEKSKGAIIELQIAHWLNKNIKVV